jgi:phosphoribosylformylglycinamidine cyclo-ligase
MALVVAASAADRVIDRLAAQGSGRAWVLGAVEAGTGPLGDGSVQGTKGVDGGSVRLVGAHPS